MTDRTCQVNTNNLEAGHRQAGRLYAKMYITPAVNGNTPSNTREPCPSFLYLSSFLVVLALYYIFSLAPKAVLQIPCLPRRNQWRDEYSGVLFHCCHDFKRDIMSKPIQAVFQSQLLLSFHPLSKVCSCSKTEKQVLGGRISFPMCLCNKEKWAPIPAEISGCCFRPQNAFGCWPKTDSSIHRAIIAQLCLVLSHT